MRSIVVPISDAHDASWAVAQIIEHYKKEPVEVHLITVRHPLPLHISRFFKVDGLHDFYQQEGMAVLEPAVKALNAAGIPHHDHVLVGHRVETIVGFAKRHHCEPLIEDKPPTIFSFFGVASTAHRVHRLMHTHAPS